MNLKTVRLLLKLTGILAIGTIGFIYWLLGTAGYSKVSNDLVWPGVVAIVAIGVGLLVGIALLATKEWKPGAGGKLVLVPYQPYVSKQEEWVPRHFIDGSPLDGSGVDSTGMPMQGG